MAEYFAMGGYAAYIWPAYGVAAVVLVGLLVASVRGLRHREAVLQTLEAARPARARRRDQVPVEAGSSDGAEP